MRLTAFRRGAVAIAGVAAAALVLSACASDKAATDTDSAAKDGEKYTIGISQFVQHPALDAASAGFKAAFKDAGISVEWQEKNANGDVNTAVSVAQELAGQNLDMVLAVATPAAQSAAQMITDVPVLFTAVTDAVSAELVESNEAPGSNVTGTSDMAPLDKQFELIKELVPAVQSVGIVYASGEVNSQVQVDAAQKVAADMGIKLVTKTVTTGQDIAAAVEALGDVDAIYVPTDNLVVANMASLVQPAEDKGIPVIGAESGTVENGAVITLGIDYKKLGYQTGEMAIKILQGKAKPAQTPVEISKEFSFVVNPGAAERMGVKIPQEILDKAELVGAN